MRGARLRRAAGALIVSSTGFVLLLSACGQEQFSAPSSTVTTSTRPQSLANAMGRLPPTAGDVAPEEEEAVADTGQEAPPVTQPPQTTAPITIIDREELEEQAPDIGYVQRCVELGAAYAKLHLLALDGAQGAREANGSATAFKAFLPPGLHDELDVVVSTVATVARQGPLEAAALEFPTYKSANSTLGDFFDTGCPI